jgi:hypothetical protein
MRAAQVISVFDRVDYERAYYAGCPCKRGRAPLDEQFGLEPGSVTAGLAALLALAGIEFSYDQSPKWLRDYLLFDVAQNTVRSETETMGVLQQEFETELIQHSQDETRLQARMQDPGLIPLRLYGSLDAAKVRTEPRPKAGEEKAEHEDWRDMKVVCWFEVENVPPSQRSARQREKIAREQPALRAKNLRYFCDIAEAKDFGQLVWATGCDLKADLSPELVFLGDGAEWIWNLVSHYYAQAVQIVDWYHASEYLPPIAESVFDKDTPEYHDWLEQARTQLWEGQIEDLIHNCQLFASIPAATKAVHAAVSYFTHNRKRMDYARFRQKGYFIGSGTVESAGKQIASLRLKRAGARWTKDGAVATAKARAAWLSNQWDDLAKRRAALPLAS